MTYTHDFPHVDFDILNDRQAAILQLHYADGWKLRRIARAFECDESTIRYHHKRALWLLRSRDVYCLGYGESRTSTHTLVEGQVEPAQDEGSGQEA